MTQWLTIGMSAYLTPGFQDTSRLMTDAFDGGKAAYVEPPLSFSAWKQPSIDKFRWRERASSNISILSPPLPIPSKLDVFHVGRFLHGHGLATRLARLFGIDWRHTTVVYITNWTPYLVPLVEKIHPQYVVFDLVDDVLSFPYAWNRSAIVESWQRLASKASLILGVSPAMCEQSRELFGKSALYLPNGVDTRFFHPADIHTVLPEMIRNSKKGTRIGFAGTLNHWIDFDSISRIANALPETSLFLMGKVGHFGSDQVKQAYEKTRNIPNIHYLGPIEYELLPAYLNAMDIFILPRIKQKSSEASSPLKLYEYLAIGKPIVTSGIPIPDELTGLVYSTNQSMDLIPFIRNALEENDVNMEKRKNYVKNHTWQQRVEFVRNQIGL